MSSLYDRVRESIRAARREAGLSQQELSRRCGFNKTYVGKIERGETDPSFEILVQVSEALERSPVDLFAGNPEFPREPSTGSTAGDGFPTVATFLLRSPRMMGLLDGGGTVIEFDAGESSRFQTPGDVEGQAFWEMPVWSFREGAKTRFRERVLTAVESKDSHLLRLVGPPGDRSDNHLVMSELRAETPLSSRKLFEILPTAADPGGSIDVADVTTLSHW